MSNRYSILTKYNNTFQWSTEKSGNLTICVILYYSEKFITWYGRRGLV